MPTCRLLNEQGQWLTDARLGSTEWKPGDRIPRGRDTLEVVDVRSGTGDEFVTLIVRDWPKEPLAVSPRDVGSSGPPWRLRAVEGISVTRRTPDEASP